MAFFGINRRVVEQGDAARDTTWFRLHQANKPFETVRGAATPAIRSVVHHANGAESTQKWRAADVLTRLERQNGQVEAPPHVMERLKDDVYLTLDAEIAAAGRSDLATGLSVARLSDMPKQIEKSLNLHIKRNFEDWVLGKGQIADHVKAGWWPKRADGTTDPAVPPWLKRGPLSQHPSVTAYFDRKVDAKYDFISDMVKMRERMQAGEPGTQPSLEDLWMYYKFVVLGLDEGAEIDRRADVMWSDGDGPHLVIKSMREYRGPGGGPSDNDEFVAGDPRAAQPPETQRNDAAINAELQGRVEQLGGALASLREQTEAAARAQSEDYARRLAQQQEVARRQVEEERAEARRILEEQQRRSEEELERERQRARDEASQRERAAERRAKELAEGRVAREREAAQTERQRKEAEESQRREAEQRVVAARIAEERETARAAARQELEESYGAALRARTAEVVTEAQQRIAQIQQEHGEAAGQLARQLADANATLAAERDAAAALRQQSEQAMIDYRRGDESAVERLRALEQRALAAQAQLATVQSALAQQSQQVQQIPQLLALNEGLATRAAEAERQLQLQVGVTEATAAQAAANTQQLTLQLVTEHSAQANDLLAKQHDEFAKAIRERDEQRVALQQQIAELQALAGVNAAEKQLLIDHATANAAAAEATARENHELRQQMMNAQNQQLLLGWTGEQPAAEAAAAAAAPVPAAVPAPVAPAAAAPTAQADPREAPRGLPKYGVGGVGTSDVSEPFPDGDDDDDPITEAKSKRLLSVEEEGVSTAYMEGVKPTSGAETKQPRLWEQKLINLAEPFTSAHLKMSRARAAAELENMYNSKTPSRHYEEIASRWIGRAYEMVRVMDDLATLPKTEDNERRSAAARDYLKKMHTELPPSKLKSFLSTVFIMDPGKRALALRAALGV